MKSKVEESRKATDPAVYTCTGCKRETGDKETVTQTDDDGEVSAWPSRVFHGQDCRVCSPDAQWDTEGPIMIASMVCPWCSTKINFPRYENGHTHFCKQHTEGEHVPVLMSPEWSPPSAVAFDLVPAGSTWREKKAFKGRYGTYRRSFKVVGHGYRRSRNTGPLVFLKPLNRHRGQHNEPAMNPTRLMSAFERTDT